MSSKKKGKLTEDIVLFLYDTYESTENFWMWHARGAWERITNTPGRNLVLTLNNK